MRTKHFCKRMAQRAISDELITLVFSFGTRDSIGRVRLDRKSIKAVLTEVDRLKKQLLRAEMKGGIVVVEGDEGALVTTYGLGR